MHMTLIGKAKARRVLALNGLSGRRATHAGTAGTKFLPPLGNDQIGALFAASRAQFDRNIFVV
jgi:hypothetical protein